MRDVGAAAHRALRSRSAADDPRPRRSVALLALESPERCQALEYALVAAGFEVRHAPSAAGAADVPVATGAEALALLGGPARPDESTPGAVAALREAGWDHVVVLGGERRPAAVAEALAGGARGYLVAPPSRSVDGVAQAGPAAQPVPVNDVTGRERTLSPREIQVLALAADGLSNPEIALRLGLSALTVKSHLSRMTRRLGARDRAHLVLLALRAGVIV